MTDDRVPPHDLDAEASVLSAILTEPTALGDAREILTAADFYADSNRRIYEAACAIDDSGSSVDLVSVAGALNDTGRLKQVGGSPYLLQLIEGTPACHDVEQHCRRVAEKARVRRVILTAQTIAAEGYGESACDPRWSERVEQRMFDAVERGAHASPTSMVGPLAQQIIVDAGRRSDAPDTQAIGVRLPWPEMRGKFPGGIRRRMVHVVAARPGMGKSAYCSDLCRRVAGPELGALIVSLEMPGDDIALRILSAESCVSQTTIANGEPTRDQWCALTDAAATLDRLPVAVCFRPGASIPIVRSTIRREAARMRAEHGATLGLVVVDYLQIMRGPNRQSRESEVSEISRELLVIAGELDVALVAVSQLNRDLEKRPNKRPQLSDLRESGAIEQDAYSVTFLYRDDYYDADCPKPGICEVSVAKHRNGPIGSSELRFRGELCRFDSLTEEALERNDAIDDFDCAERYP